MSAEINGVSWVQFCNRRDESASRRISPFKMLVLVQKELGTVEKFYFSYKSW